MTRALDRTEHERQYMKSLQFLMDQGIASSKYDVAFELVDLRREGNRSWAVVSFRVSELPNCLFQCAGLVWSSDNGSKNRPQLDADLFDTHLTEILDARLWGLPGRCEPGSVLWLHGYGTAPWEKPPADEPERRAWERRFVEHLRRLLDDAGVTPLVERLELFDVFGETKALLTVRLPEQPDCIFARSCAVWVGWPTPMTAEQRAEEFAGKVTRWITTLPAPCQPGHLTWGGPEPRWFPPNRPALLWSD